MLVPSTGVAEKSDRDKPIEIEADTMTVDDTKSICTYT
jgi:lipopolysaccharide export system protein LptA